MIILFIGPQGSGKGTQAKIISKKLNLAHISTGDLLREAKGELKKIVDSHRPKGELVPPKIMIEVLKQRIQKEDCRNGIILDGFPRTLEQAQDLEKILKIDKIIEIAISDEEAIKRLNGRWNCEKCGIAYNVITAPKPKQKGICDKCGSALRQRDDDKNKEVIRRRLNIYHQDTEPILKKYSESVIKINGERTIEKITEGILEALERIFVTTIK